jgi:RNA polymerase sigma factor (sigma-70 family)
MEPGDEALIQACRHGDEAAWDQLVARYERLIFTIARHAGLEADQADDVLQRVFLILLERLETITQPTRLAAWLTATTRREVWRVRRRERLAGLHTDSSEEELAELEDDGELPDDLVLRLEEQSHVLQALERLDERCRTLLRLLFLEPTPRSYAEIAATLGMREGAIGPTRTRCLEKLRRLLE